MGTTAIVTGVQAAIWLTRVPPLWPVIVLGALAVLNAAGVVAAVVDDRRDRRVFIFGIIYSLLLC